MKFFYFSLLLYCFPLYSSDQFDYLSSAYKNLETFNVNTISKDSIQEIIKLMKISEDQFALFDEAYQETQIKCFDDLSVIEERNCGLIMELFQKIRNEFDESDGNAEQIFGINLNGDSVTHNNTVKIDPNQNPYERNIINDDRNSIHMKFGMLNLQILKDSEVLKNVLCHYYQQNQLNLSPEFMSLMVAIIKNMDEINAKDKEAQSLRFCLLSDFFLFNEMYDYYDELIFNLEDEAPSC